MKVQLSICVGGLANEEGSYYASIVVNEEVAGQTGPRTGNGCFEELVLLDDENTTVTVKIHSDDDKDDDDGTGIVMAQQTFEVATVFNSYTKAQAKRADDEDTSDILIALHATEQDNGKLVLILQGHDLPNTDYGLIGNQKTDPIYELYNHLGKKIIRSNKIEDELNPVWDEVTLELESLSGKSMTAPLRISIFDRDSGDSVEYLGFVSITVQDLLDNPGSGTKFPLLRGGAPVESATLSVAKAELLPDETVPHSAKAALDAALSAVRDLDQLKEQEAAQQEAANEAQEQAQTAKEQMQEQQAAADAVAKTQLQIQTKFSALAKKATETAKAAETREFAGTLQLVLMAYDLADVDFGFINKSDPIYEVFVPGTKEKLIRSNKVGNNLNPIWDEQELDLTKVESMDTPLKILVSDRDGKDEQVPLGTIEKSVNDLLQATKGSSVKWPLNEQPRPGKDQGKIGVSKAELVNFRSLKEDAERLHQECEALKEELDAATQQFREAQNTAEEARKVAAQAAEAAKEALEQYKAAQAAVDMAEASM